jgi:SAM-dependent methyltransferase
MSLLERLHERRVFPRRLRVLSERLAPLIPSEARALDLGAGDGSLAEAILRCRPDIAFRGLDVLVRPWTSIPVEPFDGSTIPAADGSFDVVLLVDVLHHASRPATLLAEALRVSRRFVILKDHLCEGFLATTTLTVMDRIGNARHGVALPGRYWSRRQWLEAFARIGVEADIWIDRLGLYPWPADWIFERSLHFIARLRRSRPMSDAC